MKPAAIVSTTDRTVAAQAMAALPERDRDVLIALGVLSGTVIDARKRLTRIRVNDQLEDDCA